VYFPLFVLAVYAILMGHVKADYSLQRLFTWITPFLGGFPFGCLDTRDVQTIGSAILARNLFES
jgi:hypothetical protein